MLDYCLILWKVYPNFVKSVINEVLNALIFRWNSVKNNQVHD